MKFLKYSLLPLTLLVSYLIPYFAMFFPLNVIRLTFDWHWLTWFLVGNLIAFALIWVFVLIIQLLRGFIDWLFNSSDVVTTLHGISGFLGLVTWAIFMFSDPPIMLDGNEEVAIMSWAWSNYKIRTVWTVNVILLQFFCIMVIPWNVKD